MIRFVAETGSTNADLLSALREGHSWHEGAWLVADRQTAGRGRQARAWHDGAGNFMGSTLVRLTPGDPPAASLALAAGLAVHETVAPLLPVAHDLALKWPNDLMLGGAKLAGILLERQGDWVIVGIGVNLARAPHLADRPTVALAQFGPAPDRNQFAENLALTFAATVSRWRESGLAPLIETWLAAAHRSGTPLSVHLPGGERIGWQFAGLAPDGALLLRLEDGTSRAIHAGDVMLEGRKSDAARH